MSVKSKIQNKLVNKNKKSSDYFDMKRFVRID